MLYLSRDVLLKLYKTTSQLNGYHLITSHWPLYWFRISVGNLLWAPGRFKAFANKYLDNADIFNLESENPRTNVTSQLSIYHLYTYTFLIWVGNLLWAPGRFRVYSNKYLDTADICNLVSENPRTKVAGAGVCMSNLYYPFITYWYTFLIWVCNPPWAPGRFKAFANKYLDNADNRHFKFWIRKSANQSHIQ